MKKILFMVALVAAVAFSSRAQGEDDDQTTRRRNKYIGLGMGLDYGGLGGKLEFMPTKHLGLFAGVGYNFLSIGWNAGASVSILPDKKVSPVARVFYGYNATAQVKGTDDYDKTSYGVTFGGGVNIKMRQRGDMLSVSLLIPVRSKSFSDHYDYLKTQTDMTEMYPILISVGFNFCK
jgi:hypothetical protein